MEMYSASHGGGDPRAGEFRVVYGDGTAADGSSGSYQLWHYSGSNTWTERFQFTDQGTFHADADVTAYSSTVGSDRKLKTNIVDTKYGLKDVLNLRGVDFNWKEKREGVRDVGLIAQEVQEVVPELVKEFKGLNGDEPYLTVDYAKMVPILIESIKELKIELNMLKGN